VSQAANTKAIKNLFAIVSKMNKRLETCEKGIYAVKVDLTSQIQTLEVFFSVVFALHVVVV
jgi:hypothetical protein